MITKDRLEKRKTKTYIQIGGDLRKNRKEKKTKKKNNHIDHHENGHEDQRKLKTTGKKEKKEIHIYVYVQKWKKTTMQKVAS